MMGQLERALRPVMDRVRGLIARGSVRRYLPATIDRLGRFQVSLGGKAVHDDIVHAQPYGFGSRPRAGAEAWILFPHGGRSAGYAIVTDDRRGRPALEEGEATLYNAVTGTSLVLAADGSVRVVGDLVVEGNISASGTIEDAVGSIDEIRSTYNVHTHGTSAGPTTPPTPPLPEGGGA
jgi:phage gp45-like